MKKHFLKVFFSSLLVAIFALINHNVASASTLTEAQKEELYKQYLDVVEDVKIEFKAGPTDIKVSPIQDFTDGDWVEPEVFRERAIERLQSTFEEFTLEESPNKQSIMSITPFAATTKQLTLYHRTTKIIVSFSADFTIRHDSTQQRMVFSNYSNLNISPNQGSWTTTGVEAVIIEGGRTYKFKIGGYINYLGLVSEHTPQVTFSCSATGVIS